MQMDAKEIENAIYELGVILVDEMNGLVAITMQQNFWEKYKNFDLMVAWECFVDEVNRVNKVLELHDELCDITEEQWEQILSDTNERDN